MQSIAYLGFLVGIILVAVANFGMRSESAPAIGSGPWQLPWKVRDRYKGAGYGIHLAGLVLWLVSVVLLVAA